MDRRCHFAPDQTSDSIPESNVPPAIAERHRKVNTSDAFARAYHLSTAPPKSLRSHINIDNRKAMGETRIDKALARIDAAVARMDTARESALAANAEKSTSADAVEAAGSARVMELVNRHEDLREEVAETLRELDTLIEDLEGG